MLIRAFINPPPPQLLLLVHFAPWYIVQVATSVELHFWHPLLSTPIVSKIQYLKNQISYLGLIVLARWLLTLACKSIAASSMSW